MVKEEAAVYRIMTVQEVAALLRISRYSVYNLVNKGELPAIKVLNKLRFSQEDVEQFLSTHRVNNTRYF